MTAVTATRRIPALGDLELPEPGTYELDSAHTHAGFRVRHLMVAKVRGQFSRLEGTVTIADDPLLSSVEVTIDAASIDTGNGHRDDHLRSADFFEVDRFPTMTFRSTSVTHVAGRDFEVDGELTIRDTTRPVTLSVTFEGGLVDPDGSSVLGFTATGRIDREAFGLTWNQAVEGGGVVVGKEIALDIGAEAVRSASA